MTPLDTAHAAMEAAPEDAGARLAFYDCLAGTELFLALAAEAAGETAEPRLFEIADGPTVLAFDSEARLAEFAGEETPYLALSGRALVGMLAGQGLVLGLNLGVAPSAMLMPPEALTWFAETLTNTPQEAEARLSEVTPPGALPEALLTALDRKLAGAEGLARFAYLAGAVYEGGGRGHLLALIDTAPGAETALASALSETLTFSGIEAGQLDIAFFAASDPMAARLSRVGLRFDLPEPPTPEPVTPPGSDPDRPPRLR